MTEIRQMIFGLLILSGVTIGMVSFTGSFLGAYNIENPNNLTSFNLIQNITTTSENATENLYRQLEDPDPVTVLWSFGANAFNALTLFANIGNIYTSLISDSIVVIGLPAWVGSLATVSITLFIILILMSAFMKWRL